MKIVGEQKAIKVNPSSLYEGGFTFIEIMVGMVVAMVVVAAAFTIISSTDKAVRANDATVDTQQNVRVAMELISRDIKHAGFGMVGTVGACAVGANSAAVVPADNTPAGPLTAINDTGPDRISVVVPTTNAVNPVWTLSLATGQNFNTITLQAGAVADMQTAAGGVLVGATISIAGTVTSTVQAAAGNVITLQNTIAAPASFPVSTPIYLLQCITYQVIPPPDNFGLCGGNAPCLVRGAAPALNCNIAGSPCADVVDGVEDLQFAYACDGCNTAVNTGIPDRIIDDQNANNAFDQADLVSNTGALASPLDPSTIRLVQVTIVARQRTGDQGFSGEGKKASIGTLGATQVADHNPQLGIFVAGDFNWGTYSAFRRRTLTRTVETRNIGLQY